MSAPSSCQQSPQCLAPTTAQAIITINRVHGVLTVATSSVRRRKLYPFKARVVGSLESFASLSMRLLHTTNLLLETHHSTANVKYAVLSHTWEDSGEILFEDLVRAPDKRWQSKSGSAKVNYACQQARQDGYDYIWIDTCCIDKSSSAELSEAINSMFRWYQDATICYAYLVDTTTTDNGDGGLKSSRWFTRGWTLQELVAPDHVKFFGKHWQYLGDRMSLASRISAITGIEQSILHRGHGDKKALRDSITRTRLSLRFTPSAAAYVCAYCGGMIHSRINKVLSAVPIAQRMRWASKRYTTREEDTAYCLMGLFDVNMPLLYGEGNKSFIRLQENILKDCKDHSILAYRQFGILRSVGHSPVLHSYQSSVLAPSPGYFQDDIRHDWSSKGKDARIRLTDGEVTITLYICPLSEYDSIVSSAWRNKYLGFLDCIIGDDCLSRPAILLEPVDEGLLSFRRCYEKPALFSITSEATEGVPLGMFPEFGDLHGYEPQVQCKFEKLRRATIKITSDEASSTYRADPGAPMRFTHATITLDSPYRPRLDAASPKFIGGYAAGLPYGDIGIIPFSLEGLELFFVAWGRFRELSTEKIWCKIWTLFDIEEMEIIGLDDYDDDESAIELIVSRVEKKQGAVARLQLAQAELSEKDEMVLNPHTPAPVLVRVFSTKETFIGRSIFHMKLHIEPWRTTADNTGFNPNIPRDS